MILHFPVIVLYLNAIFVKSLGAKVIRTCVYHLTLYNDGPVTLDVPVTISAFLDCADEEEEYLFVFEDYNELKIAVPGHQTAAATFVFANTPGARNVKVTAYLLSPQRMKVASGNTVVEVHDYIPGNLVLSGTVTDDNGQRYAASGTKTNISVEIYYPSRVFQEAEFSYSWTIGESRFTSSHPYLIHRFLDPGPQWIRAAVVARIPSYDDTNGTRYKWGYFDAQLFVKNPFTYINITGNTYLQHGQLINLDISCSGSGPVDYCWKVLPSSENYTNLSCSDTVSVIECSFPIIYYFQESGDFSLAIYIDNLVSSQQRNIEIHIYDVSLRPQLSTVIIPMVCTVLVLLIVASAVVVHVRRSKNYDIETADFDFMVADETGALAVETSWEYMRRSFLQLLRMPCIYYATNVQKVDYGTIFRH